jgi:two-component system LytT family sensor kinase
VVLKVTIGKLEPFYIYVIYYTLNISLFYSVVFLMNRTFNQAKPKFLISVLGFLILLVVFQALKTGIGLLLEYLNLIPSNNPVPLTEVMVNNLYRFSYFVILGTFFWAAGHISYFRSQFMEAERQKLITKNQRAELEIKLSASRNAYLQQQINPHMLFNTLNFIYNSVYEYSNDGARCVYLLSEIMRFSLEATGDDEKTNLKSEIVQIQNMIEINSFRYDHHLALNAEFNGDLGEHRILPLILLTLTENLFKHADLRNSKDQAVLSIRVDNDNKLYFHSRNRKKLDNPYKSGGIGLTNVRIRLEHSYPGNYELTISNKQHEFELFLTINL